MKHSIVLRVGENLVYQQAPTLKPVPESTSSPVEYNRALPEWEQTAKSCLIKKQDFAEFEKHINPDQLNTGSAIPFELVEIYEEEGATPPRRKYARINKNVKLVDGGGEKPTFSVAFICKICEDSQEMPINTNATTLLICDQCIKDLKEMVLDKRNKK